MRARARAHADALAAKIRTPRPDDYSEGSRIGTPRDRYRDIPLYDRAYFDYCSLRLITSVARRQERGNRR